ncbi:MAG: hypothetical protein JWQ42_3266 [Edaphobacter sp.]|nr:hypothetical protein [Edaphobacter sp.]
MRFFSSSLLLTLCGAAATLSAQTPASPAEAQAPRTPSEILQPALSTLQPTLDALRTDKWKTSGAAREETEANINSIRRDLETTLPPLLATADAAPGSITQVLPAYRNIEALYDVLLRVAAVARSAAPTQQSAPLEQAMASLDAARRDLGDRLQAVALTQDQQVRDLQTKLRAIPAAPAPAPAVCPTEPPAKKRRPRPKPTQKTTPAPTASQSGAPPSP